MATYDVVKKGNEEQLARGLGWFSLGLGLAEFLAPGPMAQWVGLPERQGVVRAMGLRAMASGLGIFAQRRPTGAVWSRVVGDTIDLACLGAAFTAPNSKKGRLALATVAVLGVAAMDVICAQQLGQQEGEAVRTHSVTINRTPEEVYHYWRNFENLPRFMNHLESVKVLSDTRSHWVAKGPAGTSVEWDAEITQDRPGELIAWRSLEGAQVSNSGQVSFAPAPGGRGTEIHVQLEYTPPGGALGAGVAKLFGEEPGQQIKDDLRRFKQVMETGEIVHSDSSIHRGLYPSQPAQGAIEDLT